ncbi:MAG TPA: SDR family oxidoreductase [Aurantimonas coralicida]|uniref:SDR family oxidoreductase n=2 Tax=root TaxID=1 RepID=A0A9C9NDM7_9HYPH|nr:SDR family oxidoreductase [Aurantimonas coralicida]HEU00140.1 SDR family oxidoreductase [Aurantimonas coralicida]
MLKYSLDRPLLKTRAPDKFYRSTVKTIAITGGAGFLGSHLCERLVANGHRVVVFDNFHTGRPENVAHLTSSNRFSLLGHDVSLPLLDEGETFNEIWNLACPASPVHYQENPVRTAFVCADGARHVMDRADADRARVFHASTSEIYGDPERHPQREDYFGNVNSVGPRSCYDEGKRFAETVFTDFAQRSGLDLRMARIFNTYGPRMQMNDGRVVSNFIVQALNGDDITIYGNGSQTRSFCFVDDLIDGFLALMTYDGPNPGPVNLGNPVETTVGELAETILAMIGSRSRLMTLPCPVDDPRRRCPDISKARMLTDWEPRVALADGLARTISYFDALLSSGKVDRREAVCPPASRRVS